MIMIFACMGLMLVSGQQAEDAGALLEMVSPGIDLDHADIDSLFLEANKLYQQGQYEPALERYNAVILSGSESADLYYNMGNAAFRANSIGHSILYYEKALKIEPTHEDAIHNLDAPCKDGD